MRCAVLHCVARTGQPNSWQTVARTALKHSVRLSTTPHIGLNAASGRARPRASLVCHYTSVKERLGEPGPDPEDENNAGNQDNQEEKWAQQQAGNIPPPTKPNKSHQPAGTHWRVKDAADERAATSVLKGIEAEAVAANPDQAGHPEQHRVLRTEDYSDEPDEQRSAGDSQQP